MTAIYLASSSPRRRELLNQIGLPYKVLSLDVDENLPPGLSPAEQVTTLAWRKAEAAARQVESGVVIAADTVVALGDKVLGKPDDESGSLAMLKQLQGKTHQVYTGLTLWRLPDGPVLTDFECTGVHLRRIGREELERYVKTGEPADKAGAYGIQGRAAVFVSGIEGCYFNVVGLPLFKLAQMLKELGLEITGYWG